ncbi:QWRF family [Sesbania bispinosa]|nr:QWRF family [Sesbania bispinosa]
MNMKSPSNDLVSTVSPKPRTRQVSSRYLSPSPTEPGSASPTDSRRWLKTNSGTLADHIGNDRLKDREEHHLHCQNKKPTTTPTSVFPVLRKQRSCREFNNSENENDQNQTFIGRSKRYSFPEKSSSSRSSSVKKTSCDDSGVVSGRLSLDENAFSSDDSWMVKKLITQKVIKRANSLTGLRPPNKSVEKILNMGFDLFRNKKSSVSSSSSSEAFYQLRLLDNRLLQWRFANARAHAVNHCISLQAERNLIYALDGLTKLRGSVLQKKIQLERERLQMKLNFVLHSHMRLLETWGSIERQHLAAVTAMKECLHSAVCKVPLLEGAKVDIQLASIAQKRASDLTASIKSVLSNFSPLADKTAELLSELAEVVAQERLLLEEFNDLLRTLCVLELKERSLKCSLIQLKG